jgi:hypothetical protein
MTMSSSSCSRARSSCLLHQPYKVVFDRVVSAERHVTTIVGFDEAGKEVRKLQLTFSRAR